MQIYVRNKKSFRLDLNMETTKIKAFDIRKYLSFPNMPEKSLSRMVNYINGFKFYF